MQQPQWSFFICFGLCHLNLYILYDNFPPSFFFLSCHQFVRVTKLFTYKMPHILNVAVSSRCLTLIPLTPVFPWTDGVMFQFLDKNISQVVRGTSQHSASGGPSWLAAIVSVPDCSVASAWSLRYISPSSFHRVVAAQICFFIRSDKQWFSNSSAFIIAGIL